MSIGNVVSSEKTSKLMEMILTLTKPYGLIFGKIFAMATIAILQMFLWIGCFVGGFFAGNFVAKEMIYPEYSNVIIEVFELISNQDGSTAFTVGAFVLSIVTVCIGFLFYCVIAGTCASFATKAEDLAQAMSIYQLIMIGGFFCAYMLPMQEKAFINTILRIVPITSAYLLPGDLVVGNVSVGLGCLYFGILLLTTLVLLVVAGKVYKNQMFYRGQSILDRFKKKKKQK
jgi:ABC-type Na+ efflux pump permease subunit